MSTDPFMIPAVTTQEYEIGFDSLGLTQAHIEWAMGYDTGGLPDPLPGLVAELLEEAPEYIAARAGVRTLCPEKVQFDRDCMTLDGVRFATGERIAALLNISESMAVFAATVGEAMDDWIRDYFESGATLRGFVADAIGSEAVERAADWIEEIIIDRAIEKSHYTTSRFSPGFCDWSLSEQHELFSLLPPRFCGITLTPMALMVPVKSVSGIIGIGPLCERATTACMICTLETCFRRR